MIIIRRAKTVPPAAPVVAPTVDPATTAWVNAVVGAGGTVSGTEQGYVDTLIKGLKTDSLFTSSSRLWLLASENLTQATIDIVNLASWTKTGTVTFSANAGMTGDAATGFLDTSFTGDVNATLNSATFACYCTNNRTAGQTYDEFGATDSSLGGGAEIELLLNADGVQPFGNINDNSGTGSLTPAIATSQGFWALTRTGANARALYRNGGSVASDTQVSTGYPDRSLYVFARNAGSINRPSGDTLTAFFIGAGFNATQMLNLSNRINAYMGALGISVY